MATESVLLFISYSHKEEELRKELGTHLMPLRRQGLISTCYDRMIETGSKWNEAIKAQLMAADIILLLAMTSSPPITAPMSRSRQRCTATWRVTRW